MGSDITPCVALMCCHRDLSAMMRRQSKHLSMASVAVAECTQGGTTGWGGVSSHNLLLFLLPAPLGLPQIHSSIRSHYLPQRCLPPLSILIVISYSQQLFAAFTACFDTSKHQFRGQQLLSILFFCYSFCAFL